ncbi:MAG TPA: Clp protease N-terminal domain-containing protein [Micromonosporaceae bacterium]|jgi:ATP-dependent Clp protease ATP-binding subunit ClpC
MVPKINVYLSDELADAVKEAGLSVSAICQRALEQAVGRVIAIREATANGTVTFGLNDQMGTHFTKRAYNMVVSAAEDAGTQGQALGTAHLLRSILLERENLAVRVLTSMEIEPEELAHALYERVKAGAVEGAADGAAEGEVSVSSSARAVLQLAATEATSLGHNYIGSEHLLLGMVAEPDGVAGEVLRAAGLELRQVRRSVVAALAGYQHLRANAATKPAMPSDPIAALNSAISAQLAPIVERLNRLEQR